jgi:hypothetical protein
MIDTGQLTSILVKDQLPEHIRDNSNYENFHTFLKAYYEWMEQTGKVSDRTKNLLSYKDVDETTEEFLDYFTNDFLPFFPKETLLSKEETIKVARQLYQTKGTPASYEFLFRVLFNSEFEVFNTKEAVFKASSGLWYVSKSLKLASSNRNFLNTKNLRVFGIESKSIATIEAAVLVGEKTEIFISDIERLFESGEFVKIVDSNNQDVLFDGEILTAKIVGQISQIKINSQKRGSLYQPGDPVVVYDGMDDPVNGVGASAIVSETTKGSLQRINVVNGGFGYSLKPNTIVTVLNGGGAKANVYALSEYLPPSYTIVNAGTGYRVNDRVNHSNAAFAYVTSVNQNGAITGIKYVPSVNAQAIVSLTATVESSNPLATGAIITTAPAPGNARANVSYIPIDVIGFKDDVIISNSHFFFANMASANVNTRLIDALSFSTLETSSIFSMVVDNGGGGIAAIPDIQVTSTIPTEDEFDTYSAARSDIAPLGILAPIQIIKGGGWYQANDKIVFSGGSGRGAYANVTSVGANGTITGISYVFNPNDPFPMYPLGGTGYKNEFLPAVTVQSANAQASGAILTVPGILGTGAEFSLVVDRVGSVTSIALENYGEDYSSQPGVSLKVQDIVVSNVAIENLPRKGEYIYQGPTIDLSTYTARVNSISLLAPDANTELSLYNLQVFNYNSNPNPNLMLKILGEDRNINLKMANSAFPQFTKTHSYYDASGNKTVFTRNYNKQGYISYGDGSAKANATFLNGLVIGEGQYLTTQGQPSSFDIMQDDRYNNFTYLITVDKEISKYREVLLGLLHPVGSNVLGRYGLKSYNNVNLHSQTASYTGKPWSYYAGEHVSDAITIVTDFTNKSNNVIKFNHTPYVDLEEVLTPHSTYIQIESKNGPNVYSEIIGVNGTTNEVTLASNVWLTYSNVAVVTGNSGSNALNITSLTGLFDLMNNGNYSDSEHPIKDIVYKGDTILVDNNTSKVVNTVDYVNQKIYLTTNLTAHANSHLAVKRNFVANSTISSNQIKIIGSNGLPYVPAFVSENGILITTEQEESILLG